jgi:hypothetical protein
LQQRGFAQASLANSIDRCVPDALRRPSFEPFPNAFSDSDSGAPDVTKLGTAIVGKFQFPSLFIDDGQRCLSSVDLGEQLGLTIVPFRIDTCCQFAGTFIANP